MARVWPYAALAACIIFAFSPYSSPAIALVVGMGLSLAFGNPMAKEASKVSKTLLQLSVVLIGFKMQLMPVLLAGGQGLIFAFVTIVATFAVAVAVSRWLAVTRGVSVLVASGTAICGGSAIAAVGATLRSKSEDMAVSIGTIFLLNSAALLAFPPLGHLLGLNGEQFGIWAGIAIHDVSSVAGAAKAFGNGALETAMPVKLSRALWIAPMALVVGRMAMFRDDAGEGKSALVIPWFIFAFVAASALATFVPLGTWGEAAQNVGVAGFTVTLFLIGSTISREALLKVGWRPIALGMILWVFISGASLAYILLGGR